MKIKKKIERLFLNYHTIKKMRYEQILWRIFFILKKVVVRRLNPIVSFIYYNKYKNASVDSRYEFFSNIDSLNKGDIKEIFEETKSFEGTFNKEAVCQIVENRGFCFLNKKVSFKDGIDWQDKKQERLWLYNLHYFDYAFELGLAYAVEKDELYFKTFKSLAMDWISKNGKIGCGTGWEPYPLSLRIVNFIYAYSFFQDQMEKDHEFESKFLDSLLLQSGFLNGIMEYHVSRNHLIKNAKALFLSGIFFDNAQSSLSISALRWKTKGKNILIKEINEQVLGDGGHYERCPMYHLIVLQDYLELFILSKRNNIEFDVEYKLKKMYSFLVGMLHPDGQIPLFNDSAFGIAKEPWELLQIGSCLFENLFEDFSFDKYGEATLYTKLLTGEEFENEWQHEYENSDNIPVQTLDDKLGVAGSGTLLAGFFEDSGFCVMRNKDRDLFCVISCKEPSPTFLPGHSHSDILSYELSLVGKRFIVDSGANNYLNGDVREFFRSTKAHNTLTVNGKNQSELWGVFGIARRATMESSCLKSDSDGVVMYEGVFAGFPGLSKIYHKRSFFFVDDKFWIILDCVSGSGDKPFRIDSFIHIHPERDVEICSDNCHNGWIKAIKVKSSKHELIISPIKIDSLLMNEIDADLNVVSGLEDEKQGWYSDNFGVMLKNSVVEISSKGNLPLYTGYMLYPRNENSGEVLPTCKLNATHDLSLDIITPDSTYLIKGLNKEIFFTKTENVKQ